MADLGKAYVQIIPSAEGISGSISGVLSGEASSAGEVAGGLLGEGCISAATAAIAAGAVVVAGAVAATIKLASDTAQFGDTVDKQAQKIGISNQAYQEWSFILQHCGSDIGVMQRSMKTLSGAVDSNSSAFGALGLSMEEVRSMSQEDLFSRVISGLQNMEPGLERNSVASDLLGRNYQELAPLLNMTASETENMRQSLTDLGGVMSDEAVKNGAAYQDALLDMQTAFDGIKRSIGSEVVPIMAKGMESVAKFISSGDGFAKLKELVISLGSGIIETVSPAVSVLTDAWGNLRVALDPVITKIQELFTNLGKTNTQFSIGKVVGKGLGVVIRILSTAMNVVAKVISVVFKVMGTLVNLWTRAKGVVSSFASSVKNAFSSIKNHITNVINAIKSKFDALRNFKWLKIPHISVSGKAPFGLGGAGEKPSFKITWNKKAMANPYIFSDATLFGAGEAGDEILYGRSALMHDIELASTYGADNRLSRIEALLEMYLPNAGNNQLVLDTGAFVGATVGQYDKALGRLRLQKGRTR